MSKYIFTGNLDRQYRLKFLFSGHHTYSADIPRRYLEWTAWNEGVCCDWSRGSDQEDECRCPEAVGSTHYWPVDTYPWRPIQLRRQSSAPRNTGFATWEGKSIIWMRLLEMEDPRSLSHTSCHCKYYLNETIRDGRPSLAMTYLMSLHVLFEWDY